jgi:hypothetical protein
MSFWEEYAALSFVLPIFLIIGVPIAIILCCCCCYARQHNNNIGRLTLTQPASNPPGPIDFACSGGPPPVQGYYYTGPPPSIGLASYPAPVSSPPPHVVDFGQVKAML